MMRRCLRKMVSIILLSNADSETQYQYGWKLLESKDKTLYEYLIKEKETNDGISNSLKKDESNPTVKLRLQQLLQKNNIIMDALSYYD